MIDYGGQKTDLAVRRAEWRLSRVYRQAAREIDEKMQAWQKGHEARDKKYRQMVKDGKLSKADYDVWMRGQIFQGKQWEGRKEQIRQVLLNSDKAAVNVIKEGKLGVFASNANYIGYGLEHDSGLNTGFLLYDEATVARLIKGDPKMLPMLPPEKAVNKDKAYTYYNKLITGAITQGIIQGEDIGQIAHRIATTTGEKCYKSAVRNARTAYTGAQNAGRIEGMHQAQRLGIKMQKQWLATPDGRTRHAHAELDGQIQNVDDPFESALGDIDYPGDPNADPANVYNCRCSLLYVYPEYPAGFELRDDFMSDLSMDDWETAKQEEAEEINPYADAEGKSWGQFEDELPDDLRKKIEKELYANRGSKTLNEYWNALTSGRESNETISRLLAERTSATTAANAVTDKERGMELYRRFVEGGSTEIHVMAGVDPIHEYAYNPKNVDEDAMRALDSVFKPAGEKLHVYKGFPMSDEDIDNLHDGVNHTLSSTSTSKAAAKHYMENAYELDMNPVFMDIEVDADVPVADAQKLLGNDGMKAFEKEITIGRNVRYEYSEPELMEDDYGDEWYYVKVKIHRK